MKQRGRSMVQLVEFQMHADSIVSNPTSGANKGSLDKLGQKLRNDSDGFNQCGLPRIVPPGDDREFRKLDGVIAKATKVLKSQLG